MLCSGFSLGAALATLCGPWAQATFPNVSPAVAAPPRCFCKLITASAALDVPSRLDCCPKQAVVEVVTAGSPRVFNPAAAQWYDAQVQNNYRVVNNKDIVPSLPLAKLGYVHIASAPERFGHFAMVSAGFACMRSAK